MADFLTAVVRGEMKDFKPHHWIRAAKHLAARAYSREVDPERPGLSAQDAMKLIDKLFPGFKHYHRVDMKQIIHLGFQDMAADDRRPSHDAALSRPYNRPDFDAVRAQYEAGVRAETEREDEAEAAPEAEAGLETETEAEAEAEAEPEPFPHKSGFEVLRARYEARLRAEAKRRYLEEDGADPADRRSESETEDYESRPSRPSDSANGSARPSKRASISDGTAASRPDPDRPTSSFHNRVAGRLLPLPPRSRGKIEMGVPLYFGVRSP